MLIEVLVMVMLVAVVVELAVVIAGLIWVLFRVKTGVIVTHPKQVLDKVDGICQLLGEGKNSPPPGEKIPTQEEIDRFDPEEALATMNEWEHALADRQRQAWEIQHPGQRWKLTPYIYQQIKRGAERRVNA